MTTTTTRERIIADLDRELARAVRKAFRRLDAVRDIDHEAAARAGRKGVPA